MNPAGDQLLELEILGQTYHVRIQGSKEWAQKVGKIVDETMQEIQSETRLQDTTKVAILAALNLADRLLILQDARSALAAEVESASQQVAEVLDQALS
jgi:cell division protein ZapA